MPRKRSIPKAMQRNARNGFTVLNFNDMLKNNNMYKKQYNKSFAKKNIGYDMSRGFFYKDDTSWSRNPQNIPKRAVRLADGRTVYVYDSGYKGGNFIPFSRMEDDDKLSEYIESTNFTWSVEGCGHIAMLQYSPRRSVMRVDFQEQTDPKTGKTWGRADTAYFFNVPSGVFGELYYLAQSKTTAAPADDGRTRHALGIRFWDLVRIRGSLYGSRYPYKMGSAPVQTARNRAIPPSSTQGVAPRNVLSDEQVKKPTANKEAVAITDAKILDMFNGDVQFAKKYLDGMGKNFGKAYTEQKTLTDKYMFLSAKGML